MSGKRLIQTGATRRGKVFTGPFIGQNQLVKTEIFILFSRIKFSFEPFFKFWKGLFLELFSKNHHIVKRLVKGPSFLPS